VRLSALIVVNVFADNSSRMVSFRFDYAKIVAIDKDSSVFYRLTITVGCLINIHLVIQAMKKSHFLNYWLLNSTSFVLLSGQSVALTLVHTAYPLRLVLTYMVPCSISILTPTFFFILLLIVLGIRLLHELVHL
jgi:hypothetical protein